VWAWHVSVSCISLPILVLTSASEGSEVAGLRNCDGFELTQWSTFGVSSLNLHLKNMSETHQTLSLIKDGRMHPP
jgi:hypothetical protein